MMDGARVTWPFAHIKDAFRLHTNGVSSSTRFFAYTPYALVLSRFN